MNSDPALDTKTSEPLEDHIEPTEISFGKAFAKEFFTFKADFKFFGEQMANAVIWTFIAGLLIAVGHFVFNLF